MDYKFLLVTVGLSLSLPVFADNAVFESCTSSEEVSLDAVVKWHWQGSSVLPSYNQVMSTPIVVPLEDTNGDGEVDENDVPSVVFNATGPGVGVLRALSGEDGSELWTIAESNYAIAAYRDIAAADIDRDGLVEIVAHDRFGGLIAFENTGVYKWRTDNLSLSRYFGIYIADLDADNNPEILVGNAVLNADGTLKWRVSSGYSGLGYPIAADLNLDSKLEVILGASAYSNTSELLWRNTTVGDGFTAIGNFDADNYPEIVIVRGGVVYLLSHQGEVVWGPIAIPGGGRGGSPMIADMDSDGKAEIGVAGAHNYVVFDTDGQVLWTAPTRDTSSSVTGSSVFDFNGDGQADVVYNDELYLRIYRGADGTELFKTSNTSGTAYEYPVIADIDNNNHADIVVASTSAFGGETGIVAFEGKDDNWMNTRKIWNQHAYSITNINDDGSVPAIPEPSWLKNNTFRSIPYLSKSGKTCISPATCQLYATQDTDINDTQFFTVSIEEPTANIAQDLGDATLNYQINPLGGLHAGHDIEAIAIHPKTDIIYVVSGNNTAGDLPKGFLYGLDAETGKLLPVGATGFRDVGDLAFSPNGILYGYAKGKGIITIDLDTGTGELWIPATQMVEGLALAKIADQTVFYGSVDQDLWTFDADSGELDIRCDNLLGETEALEMLTDSLLIFTTHQSYPYAIHFIDVQTCEILPELQVSLAEFDDVEGLALPMAACR